MKAQERDQLLGRLDGRTEDMQKDISEIKGHQQKQNGDILALKVWQARVMGAVAVILVLLPALNDDVRGVIAAVFG